METTILYHLVTHFVPKEYLDLIIIVLSAFLALEQWLAETKRVKASSTLQLITNLCTGLVGKLKGAGYGTAGPDAVRSEPATGGVAGKQSGPLNRTAPTGTGAPGAGGGPTRDQTYDKS